MVFLSRQGKRRRRLKSALPPLSKYGIMFPLPFWQQKGGGCIVIVYKLSGVGRGGYRLLLHLPVDRTAQKGQLKQAPGEWQLSGGPFLLGERIVFFINFSG